MSVYKPHTTHNSLIRSDEGLTLATSAFESLYGGQFTLSTFDKTKLSCFIIWLTPRAVACSTLSVSGDDRKTDAGRAGSGRVKKVYLQDPARPAPAFSIVPTD